MGPLIGWDGLCGHERVVASLRRAAQADRPHPAYVFFGPRGVGKSTVARTFARALLCESENRPCGGCGACVRFAAGTHPDFAVEAPPTPTGTIPVEQIAEVQRRLSFRVSTDRFRVVLFEDAASLSPVAQNKLLKTLEEPPKRTVIILLALHPGQVLQTVRSRCLKLVLGELPAPPIASWLRRFHGAGEEQSDEAALRCGGLPGQALEHLSAGVDPERKALAEKVGMALAGDAAAAMEVVQGIERDKDAALKVLRLSQELLRDAALAAAGCEVGLQHELGALSGRLAGRSPEDLATVVGAFDRAIDAVRRQVSPSGVTEDLLLHLDRGAFRV